MVKGSSPELVGTPVLGHAGKGLIQQILLRQTGIPSTNLVGRICEVQGVQVYHRVGKDLPNVVSLNVLNLLFCVRLSVHVDNIVRILLHIEDKGGEVEGAVGPIGESSVEGARLRVVAVGGRGGLGDSPGPVGLHDGGDDPGDPERGLKGRKDLALAAVQVRLALNLDQAVKDAPLKALKGPVQSRDVLIGAYIVRDKLPIKGRNPGSGLLGKVQKELALFIQEVNGSRRQLQPPGGLPEPEVPLEVLHGRRVLTPPRHLNDQQSENSGGHIALELLAITQRGKVSREIGDILAAPQNKKLGVLGRDCITVDLEISRSRGVLQRLAVIRGLVELPQATDVLADRLPNDRRLLQQL
ncbi:hypothetical protein OIY81_3210 [Cryptosporidium canis]|nr:hypothetical protein OIY81_3210 [Cryptosporidium canis]